MIKRLRNWRNKRAWARQRKMLDRVRVTPENAERLLLMKIHCDMPEIPLEELREWLNESVA